MKKNRIDYYWYNYIKKTPPKWKCIEQFIYSNEVYVEDGSIILGTLELKYKITNNEIDKEYLENVFKETFGRYISYDSFMFERDRGLRPYLKTIYLKEEEYNLYKHNLKIKQREDKLKRICQ